MTEKDYSDMGQVKAVIPPDMVITGNIISSSDIMIFGKVVGDVQCDGNISLLGSIEGNVSTGSLTIHRGTLMGDVEVRENAVLEQEAVLKGNLIAQSVRTNAGSEGDLLASGSVELQADALVQGDITAGRLSVANGARIRGRVSVAE